MVTGNVRCQWEKPDLGGHAMPERKFATEDEISLARDIHEGHEVKIADIAEVKRVNGGFWVQGWLWVSDESRAASAFGDLA